MTAEKFLFLSSISVQTDMGPILKSSLNLLRFIREHSSTLSMIHVVTEIRHTVFKKKMCSSMTCHIIFETSTSCDDSEVWEWMLFQNFRSSRSCSLQQPCKICIFKIFIIFLKACNFVNYTSSRLLLKLTLGEKYPHTEIFGLYFPVFGRKIQTRNKSSFLHFSRNVTSPE